MQNRLVENAKVTLVGQAVVSSGALTSRYVTLKNHHHCSFLVSYEVSTGTDTSDIQVYWSTDVSGTTTSAYAFTEAWICAASATSDALVKTTVTTAGKVTTAGTTAEQLVVIEVDANEAPSGYDCVGVAVTDPGNNSTTCSIVAVLPHARYAQATPPTVRTD